MWGGDPSADGLLDPDSAHEQIAKWRDRVEQMAVDTKAMSDRLRDARLTATDDTGMVEVTIDATGRLVDLKLGNRVRQVAPEQAAKTIMQTIGKATRKLGERAQEIIAETMGTESAAAREIAERVGQQLQPPESARDDDDDRSRGR
ncbi:MAG TPA: YbaB/EbfC family nucleoid-associated protein [Candidatus Limnocylindrales bacterium]|nr:YbaB/EbfC family nucleoid-associated protein [Candidatus Limnocylindrales bacterium]